MTTDIKEKMHSWSLLTPDPIVYYNRMFDEHLVAWNGCHMIPEHALMIASSSILGIHPTPEMKRIADTKARKLYYLGVFGRYDNWDRVFDEKFEANGLMSFYAHYLVPHIKKHFKHANVTTMINWFDKLYSAETV